VEPFLDALKSLGFSQTRRTSKVIEYQLPSRESVYVLTQNKTFSLVVAPDHDAALRSFADRKALKANPGYYHNIHMTRFPKRINTGRGPTHYGSKLEFRTSGELLDFLSTLFR